MRVTRGAGEPLLQLVDRGPSSIGDELMAPDLPSDGFDAFYRREFPRLVVLARVLAGPLLAEDIAQEAMLVAYRKWDEVRLFASPAGWLRSVCMHKAVSVVRRRTVEQRALRQVGSFRAAPVTALDDDERFWALVRGLPRRQAQVIALHYALDLGIAEVASTLGCAEGTVKVHLSRARTALAAPLGLREEGQW